MADRVTDEELEQALAKEIEREAEQMVSDDDPESEANLRRWIEDMRRVLRAASGYPFGARASHPSCG